MPDSQGPHRDPRQNPAWRAAQQWQQRARQNQGGGLLDSLKMLLAWLLFGSLMIVAMVFGLIFLLLGWALMPLLRHRLKKRMEQMRAEQAEDIGGGAHSREPPNYYRDTPNHYRDASGQTHANREKRDSNASHHEQQVLEGDYEIKDETHNNTDRP